jgi:8-oxo-dGTP pyrophosphatase MutT (NUDIX family)
MSELAPAIPAATVVLIRDLQDAPGIEVLMLHRTSRGAFGGMWVFPGGRVDDEDRRPDDDGDEPAARRAAAREAMEECALTVDPDEIVLLSRWTPPPVAPKRFATWFFLARVPTGDVVVDGGEIVDHRWLAPLTVLEQRDRGEIELAPPTWMTLNALVAARDVDDALARAAAVRPVVHYQTRWRNVDDGAVAMWEGDAGYDTTDVDVDGPRHRLWMLQSGWRFEQR